MHFLPFSPADGRHHGPATLTASPYLVTLRDCHAVTVPARVAAEVRFCKALERRLGSPQGVADALQAFQAIESVSQDDLSPEQKLTRARWQQATMAARLIGLADLATIGEAHFDVSI